MLKKYFVKVTCTYAFSVTAGSEDEAYEEARENYLSYNCGCADSTDAEILREEYILPIDKENCFPLAVVEYNALTKLAEHVGADWFSIETAHNGLNFIYDTEDECAYSLRTGVKSLMEEVDDLGNVELTEGEFKHLISLLKDWEIKY
jgi:hypothetical protein